MKNLIYVFTLICCTLSCAEFNQHHMANILQIPQDLAERMIERIQQIDSINTHHALYYPILSNAFLKDRGYKTGCEIGVFTGSHTNFILANSAVEKMYCIDSYSAPQDVATMITSGFEKRHWQAVWDTMYHYTVNKLSVFGNRVQFIRLPATAAADMIPNHSLDFIFIDGDHSYQGVMQDLSNYYHKIKSGGMISGDDYNIDGVGHAVRNFFEEKNLTINIYEGQERFWWVEKP